MRKSDLINIFGALFIVVTLYFLLQKGDKEEKRIIDNLKYTYGIITDVRRPGVASTPYLYYYFLADDVKYPNTVSVGKYNQPDCLTKNNCIGKKFLVIYDSTNPSRSLINMKREIYDSSNLNFFDTSSIDLNEFR